MDEVRGKHSFTSLSAFALSSSSRLPREAFCPTKDLLVLVSESEGVDRVALWKASGSKVWDISLGKQDRFVGLCWSPDGNFVMIARQPARITLHSVHDGHELTSQTIPYNLLPDPGGKGKGPAREGPTRLKDIWWLRDADPPLAGKTPGKRKVKTPKHIPGSSQSLLGNLPFITPIRAETKTDTVFSLSKDKTAAAGPALPPSLLGFPTLLINPMAAGIQTFRPTLAHSARLKDDEAVRSKENDGSLVVVSDEGGTLHFFLKGTYPLGFVNLGADCVPYSAYLVPNAATLMLSLLTKIPSLDPPDYLAEGSLHLPHLRIRSVQMTAEVSSLLRDLLTIAQQTVEDMSRQWMGAEGTEGAKDVGSKWMDILSKRGAGNTDPFFDLMSCLVTGRPRHSMAEFLGLLTERGWESWNTTVQNALKSMERHCIERIIPACERCVVILEEIRGWTRWRGQYSGFAARTQDVEECITVALRMIELSQALATHIVEERWAFDGLMVWLRYEAARLTTPGTENQPQTQPEHPGHDVLQVAEYIEQGLVHSEIDNWFSGPLPLLAPSEKATQERTKTLTTVMHEANAALNGPRTTDYRMRKPAVHTADSLDTEERPVVSDDYPPTKTEGERIVLDMDRNLVALIADLCERCQKIFSAAAGTVGRHANVGPQWLVAPAQATHGSGQWRSYRTRFFMNVDNVLTQYIGLELVSPAESAAPLCFVKLVFENGSHRPTAASAAMMECHMPDVGACELLDWDFFDEINAVLIVRPLGTNDPAAVLASVFYPDLPFISIGLSTNEETLYTRIQALQRAGELPITPLIVARSRELENYGKSRVYLALNGREGRRTACVLGNEGLDVEVFDLYGNEEPTEAGDGMEE